jgi:hypothetical protein
MKRIYERILESLVIRIFGNSSDAGNLKNLG